MTQKKRSKHTLFKSQLKCEPKWANNLCDTVAHFVGESSNKWHCCCLLFFFTCFVVDEPIHTMSTFSSVPFCFNSINFYDVFFLHEYRNQLKMKLSGCQRFRQMGKWFGQIAWNIKHHIDGNAYMQYKWMEKPETFIKTRLAFIAWETHINHMNYGSKVSLSRLFFIFCCRFLCQDCKKLSPQTWFLHFFFMRLIEIQNAMRIYILICCYSFCASWSLNIGA